MHNLVLKLKINILLKKLIKIKNFNKKNRKINDVNQVYIIRGMPLFHESLDIPSS